MRVERPNSMDMSALNGAVCSRGAGYAIGCEEKAEMTRRASRAEGVTRGDETNGVHPFIDRE